MAELTREALRLLQRHYRPSVRQELPSTLSQIRIHSLLEHGDSLVIETDRTSSDTPDRSHESTYASHALSNESSESVEYEGDIPFSGHQHTFQTTLEVNSDAADRLNQLTSEQETRGAGLSRIFDPNNRSMLLLDRTVSLGTPKRREENKRTYALHVIKESQMNAPRLTANGADSGKLVTATQKSKIPRPQSFNMPGTLKSSKSKVDLKFPKLEM